VQFSQAEFSRRKIKHVSYFRQLKTTLPSRIRLTVPPQRGMIDKDSQRILPYRNGPAR